MSTSHDNRPLFVRIPIATAQRLEAEAAARGTSKRQLVTELLGHGLGHGGASGLGGLLRGGGLSHGHAGIVSSTTEVLTLDEAAELLKVRPAELQSLAESGQVPGRRIGDEWRFARTALMGWLGVEESEVFWAPTGSRARRAMPAGFAAPAVAAEASEVDPTNDRSTS